jgi:hypothetical protein
MCCALPAEEVNREHPEWQVPLHVDAASGGFIAPLSYPELAWDFSLPWVKSINVSGHKCVLLLELLLLLLLLLSLGHIVSGLLRCIMCSILRNGIFRPRLAYDAALMLP